MEPLIFFLVLAAAVLHASWNALVKIGGDGLARLALVNAGGALCALPLLLFVSVPAPESWPFLIGSIIVHTAYYLFLVLSYRFGDLSHVYPIARGVAPMLVAVGAFVLAGERLTVAGIAAVIIICSGILSLALVGGWRGSVSKPVVFALSTGLMIAAYTVLDGLGGRSAGEVLGYIAYLSVLDSIPIILFTLYRRRRVLAETLRLSWRPGLVGGACSFSAYGLVIWAMSLTPMTYVSALRETSVILAALIGTRLLKEPFGSQRVAAAILVAAGVILLQFSRAA